MRIKTNTLNVKKKLTLSLVDLGVIKEQSKKTTTPHNPDSISNQSSPLLGLKATLETKLPQNVFSVCVLQGV